MAKQFLVMLLLGYGAASWATINDAAHLFKNYSDHIYQIRLIDLASQKKSALGTGFVIGNNGVFATNYHVIEGAITHPDKYRIEFVAKNNTQGQLTLLDVDVVNDLAVLTSKHIPPQRGLVLADAEPERGSTIYSLGNPLDIGFTVVPGTYNGIDEKSFYRRIHFSGAINSGMSGGPVLNANAQVVGVNVATAGNGIGFLVPVLALRELLAGLKNSDSVVVDFKARIADQLHNNQRKLLGQMLAKNWQPQPLGEAMVLAEIPPFVKCWGGSSNSKKRYKQVMSTCHGSEKIYLNHHFTTGSVDYQFIWLEAGKLNSWQFYSFYQSIFDSFVPDNKAGKTDVGNFSCAQSFVNGSNSAVEKVVFCSRAYRDYSDLFDVVFIGGSVADNRKALLRHFTLAGVSRDSANAFMDRFMATATWQ